MLAIQLYKTNAYAQKHTDYSFDVQQLYILVKFSAAKACYIMLVLIDAWNASWNCKWINTPTKFGKTDPTRSKQLLNFCCLLWKRWPATSLQSAYNFNFSSNLVACNCWLSLTSYHALIISTIEILTILDFNKFSKKYYFKKY